MIVDFEDSVWLVELHPSHIIMCVPQPQLWYALFLVSNKGCLQERKEKRKESNFKVQSLRLRNGDIERPSRDLKIALVQLV